MRVRKNRGGEGGTLVLTESLGDGAFITGENYLWESRLGKKGGGGGGKISHKKEKLENLFPGDPETKNSVEVGVEK